MTLILSMNTADGKISRPLSTSTLAIPDISLIRTISPLMRTASQSVRWACVCIKMAMRLPSIAPNTDAQKQTENVAVFVNIPVDRTSAVEGDVRDLVGI